MSKGIRNLLVGSMGVAGVVGLLSIVDMITAFPFAGKIPMDIMFLISAGVVGYMGYETYQEFK